MNISATFYGGSSVQISFELIVGQLRSKKFRYLYEEVPFESKHFQKSVEPMYKIVKIRITTNKTDRSVINWNIDSSRRRYDLNNDRITN